MKIAIVVFGTRGDVQPCVALALELERAGHSTFLCVPPEHRGWIASYGCTVEPFGTNVKELVKRGSAGKKKPATRPSVKKMKAEVSLQIDQLPAIVKGSDLLIGVGLVHGVPTVAEILRIPYRFMAFYPGIMGPPTDAPRSGKMLWRFGKMAMNATLRGHINKKRIADVWKNWMGENVILASEKALIPVSPKVEFRFAQTGYMFLPSLSPLDRQVVDFLANGAPPVFIGFGSNPINNPGQYARMLSEVANATGQRLIVSRGWVDLGAGGGDPNCLFVEEVPYDLLFPGVSMVIHHGGIGTLATAARAGVPQAAFPFMADQFQNQQEMIKSGIAPISGTFKTLTAKSLSRVVMEILSNDSYKTRALEIASAISGHNGTLETVRLIEKEFI